MVSIILLEVSLALMISTLRILTRISCRYSRAWSWWGHLTLVTWPGVALTEEVLLRSD